MYAHDRTSRWSQSRIPTHNTHMWNASRLFTPENTHHARPGNSSDSNWQNLQLHAPKERRDPIRSQIPAPCPPVTARQLPCRHPKAATASGPALHSSPIHKLACPSIRFLSPNCYFFSFFSPHARRLPRLPLRSLQDSSFSSFPCIISISLQHQLVFLPCHASSVSNYLTK